MLAKIDHILVERIALAEINFAVAWGISMRVYADFSDLLSD